MQLDNILKKTLLGSVASLLIATSLQAKDPNILSYIDRGIKYYPRYVAKGLVKIGKASWYGKPFHGRLTSSGERYNMYNMTAAHRTYAINTILKVTNLENKKSVKVRVNDRGPFYTSRDIDLSYGAAKKIGLTHKGVGRVKIEVISSSKKAKLAHKRAIKKRKITKIKKANTKKVQKAKYTKKAKMHTVQIASFTNMKSAKAFKEKNRLKNMIIIKKYIASKKITAYRVVVRCNAWEAKKLISSKRFKGAYLLS
jgi:rare lipoprotein A